MWIMIAGPYRSGSADPASNLRQLNEHALGVFQQGHVPIVGVNAALPIIEAAGGARYEEIMTPLSLALVDRCDGVLRIPGDSRGADEEVARFRLDGRPVFDTLDEIPRDEGERRPTLVSVAFAERFAADWIAAWNSHDLDRILAHYADSFEMISPLIIERAGEPSGRLRGKANVAAYWKAGLAATPPLKFELMGAFAGVGSVTIHYRSVGRRMAAEVLEFDAAGRVVRGRAHYGEPA